MLNNRKNTEESHRQVMRDASTHARRTWYRRHFVILIWAFLLCLLIGFTTSAVFLGYFVAERELFPHRFFARVENKLERTIFPRKPPGPLSAQTFNTHLLLLHADVGTIAVGDPKNDHPISENGGGLTSFGRDVLLLPYDGRIYAATSGSDIRFTGIVAPDNNRSAYQAVADDPKYAHLEVRLGYLRYNDLTVYDTGTERGLIASYTEYHPDRMCSTNTVAKLVFGAEVNSIDQVTADAGDWVVLFRTKPCLPFKPQHYALEGHMAGGRMALEGKTNAILTSGDFHFDGMRSEPGPGIAQNPEADYGKIIAIDILSGDHRTLSMGHRNPQGVEVMPDGTVFVVEHGPRGGDELNIIHEGANYGWPLESYGVTYFGGTRIPGSLSFGRHTNFERPVFSWVPSVATSALTRIEGFHDAWNGDLIVATLLDRSLYRLRMSGDRVIYSERIEIGSRIRDVHQHSDGRLVLWTDNQELIFLEGKERQNTSEILDRIVEKKRLSVSLANRLEETIDNCAECHSFEIGNHQKAPGLARIYGAPIGASTYEGYSDAMVSHGGDWTDENLSSFIRDPGSFVPGTSMPSAEIDDEELLEALVLYLREMGLSF